MGLDFFILEFLQKATNDTVEKFYLSVFKDCRSVTDTSIRSFSSYYLKDNDDCKTKIMDILISDTQSEYRKKLLSHFVALYNAYKSLNFYSGKTQIVTSDKGKEEESKIDKLLKELNSIRNLKLTLEIKKDLKTDKNLIKVLRKEEQLTQEFLAELNNIKAPEDKAEEDDVIHPLNNKRSGRLLKRDYNNVISKLIDLFVNEGIYIEFAPCFNREYEEIPVSYLLTIRYWVDENFDFIAKNYSVLYSEGQLIFENEPVQLKLNLKHYFYLLFLPLTDREKRLNKTAINYKLNLYEDLVKLFKDVNKKEPCIWCNPTKNNKCKCEKCKILYKAYKKFAIEFNKKADKKALLPEDLTQIIRRERDKCPNLDDLKAYRQQIKEKILKKLYFCYSSQKFWHQNINILFSELKDLIDSSFGEDF
jgi:hypothetical protein